MTRTNKHNSDFVVYTQLQNESAPIKIYSPKLNLFLTQIIFHYFPLILVREKNTKKIIYVLSYNSNTLLLFPAHSDTLELYLLTASIY